MASGKICLVYGCDKPNYCYGYCRQHYYKIKKYGDPFYGWRVGDPLAFMENSLTQNTDECITWPHSTRGKGSPTIFYEGVTVSATRLVCARVHGDAPTPTHVAAHSCGKGHEACINWKHLRWATPKENAEDMLIHGTRLRGETAPRAKLTNAQVLAIRSETGTDISISVRYNISRRTINGIRNYATWKHLP